MWSSTSLAEISNKGKKQLNLSLGLGAVYSSTPYRGADSELTPFPLVSYEGERFFLRGTRLGYHLFKKDRFAVTLLGS